VLDIGVQSQQDNKAAKTCFRTRLKGLTYISRGSGPMSYGAIAWACAGDCPGWNTDSTGI
jgi:hypothetical protein